MIQARYPRLAQPPKPSVKLLSGYIPETDTIQIDIDLPDIISTIIIAPESSVWSDYNIRSQQQHVGCPTMLLGIKS